MRAASPIAKSFAEFKDSAGRRAAGHHAISTSPSTNVLDGNEQNPRIKLFETFGATIQALKTGDVDLVLTDSTAGKGYVDASGGALKLIGGPLGAEDFGFIFPKGSDLVAPVNAAIAALKADGTFDALNKKWFLDYKLGRMMQISALIALKRICLPEVKGDFPWWLLVVATIAVMPCASPFVINPHLRAGLHAPSRQRHLDHRLRDVGRLLRFRHCLASVFCCVDEPFR